MKAQLEDQKFDKPSFTEEDRETTGLGWMMSFFDNAVEIWNSKMQQLSQGQWNKRLATGELGLPHYKGFLIETYHNAGLNPQLQGYASLFIKGRPRNVVKKFFQHAISEIGHDVLALNDLGILGVDRESVIESRPQPETSAFFANTVYNIQTKGPTAYIAYLFHLEYTPTKNGPSIIQMLSTKGIPHSAMTFLEEHSTVDINHLKLMSSYMDEFLKTSEDQIVFKHCLEDSIVLHQRVLDAGFENGEKNFSA